SPSFENKIPDLEFCRRHWIAALRSKIKRPTRVLQRRRDLLQKLKQNAHRLAPMLAVNHPEHMLGCEIHRNSAVCRLLDAQTATAEITTSNICSNRLESQIWLRTERLLHFVELVWEFHTSLSRLRFNGGEKTF